MKYLFLLLMLNGLPVLAEEVSSSTDNDSVPRIAEAKNIFELNALLGRGVNLSGLEQAVEGDWSFKLDNDAFKIIAQGGFDSVRIPIKWDSRALAVGTKELQTYTILPAFFKRVDDVVADALKAGLRVVINMHHYDDLISRPETEATRFLSLWDQVARHYANESDEVYFEILNEPAGTFLEQPELWSTLQSQALQVVRQSNPDRAVLVAPVGWNQIGKLPLLQLPDDDRLIVSVHYYDPGSFTHQGAEWVEPRMPVGVDWFPQTLRLGAGMQDWSWDVDVEFNKDSVDVTFSRSGAAFNIYKSFEHKPLSISTDVRGRLELAIICGSDGVFTDTESRLSHHSDSWTTHTADLTDCPDNTDQVAFQNLLEGTQGVEFRAGELCDSKACTPLYISKGKSIEWAFDTARLWGLENNRPINLGEFGAYDKGDLESRVRWTKAVQSAAQTRSMSSHYWEFEQGFGVWNPHRGEWVESLYQSLQQ